jgi:hypothetical protein
MANRLTHKTVAQDEQLFRCNALHPILRRPQSGRLEGWAACAVNYVALSNASRSRRASCLIR